MSERGVSRVDTAERSSSSAYNSPGAGADGWSVPAESCSRPKRTDRLIASDSCRRRRLIYSDRYLRC